MSLWLRFRHGWRVLTNRSAADRDLDDEVTHYLDELTASFESAGHSPAEARRLARLQVPAPLVLREEVRDAGWESYLTGWLDDYRYALRRLRHTPGFSLAAVCTLAIGIGATAALFAIIDGVLLKPLDFPDSGRLVALRHTAPGVNMTYLRMAPSLYFTYREESRVLENLALWNGNRAAVTGLGDPEEVPALFVTHEFLSVLGVQPALGRGFTETDGQNGAERTVILSAGYWKQHFGASPATLGQRLVLDGNAHVIIGVLPPSFEFQDEKFSLLIPRAYRRESVQLLEFSVDGIARLKPGVTLEQANADIARCLPMAPQKFPMNAGFAANAFTVARITPDLRTLHDHQVGDIGQTLWLLLGAVGLLLLIACANVANLLLVRTSSRQNELAVRQALGAGWRHITRDLLAESCLLGLTGGALGAALCFLILHGLATSSIANLPRLTSIQFDLRAAAFTLALSLAAGILFGLIPVWKISLLRTAEPFTHGGGRTISQSHRRASAQNLLILLQVALAMILLVGSGLMLRTVQALRTVDPGFRQPGQVQIVRVSLPPALAPSPAQLVQLQEQIRQSFGAVAGVVSIAVSTSAPLEGGTRYPIYTSGHDPGEGKMPPVRHTRNVSPDFATVLGSRLLAGRDFTWQELHNGAEIVLISETMAREIWGDPQKALGQQVRVSLQQPGAEIVGVMADLRDDGITAPAPAIVYWPLLRKSPEGSVTAPRNLDFLIRSPRAGTAEFVGELRQALRTVHPSVPLANVRTLGSIYARTMARTALVSVLLAVAGAMALILGLVGIYGVIAYAVSQRRKEIGIRIALGSTSRSVIALFLRQGLLLTAAGTILGTAAALALTRYMQSLLFGVKAVDLPAYAISFGILFVAAAFACWLPARRAAVVDPIQTLRST